MSSADGSADPTSPVVLRVVRGEPDADELAALVSVLASRAAVTGSEPPKRSLWAARSRQVRPPLHPAAGAWRASSLPR